jgi:hypothetical protein
MLREAILDKVDQRSGVKKVQNHIHVFIKKSQTIETIILHTFNTIL